MAAALALAALAGWIFGLPWLTTFAHGRPSMSPMTSGLTLVAAASLALLRGHRRLALLLAAAEAAGGLVVVLANALGVPGRNWIPAEWWSSQFTGLAFAVAGAAGLLLAAGRVASGQVVAFGVLLFAALLGFGHAFPAADLYGWLPGTGVAIPTVLAFLALSIGQILSFGDTGVSGALTDRNAAGRAGLRLLLGGTATALLLTAAVVLAMRRGLFDAESAVLLVAWAALVLLGSVVWGLAITVDRAERARAAAERERNQLQQMVAAAVTHDLRSPLQAATLSASLLQKRVADPAGVSALARLQRSHRRLDRLLRSLLDSLALGAGQALSFRATEFALQDLVQEVIAENEAVLGARVLREGSAEGWWDRDALFRVVENLLLNAVKYGEHGSAIVCRIAAAEGGDVALSVENRGEAIPVSEWQSIFEPFARGEGVRDGDAVGWGVGLAYARSVAISHGGRMDVAASGPEGTVFVLRLPRDARPSLAGRPAAGGA